MEGQSVTVRRPPTVQDLVDGQVHTDPLTRALMDAAEAGARKALAGHEPRMLLTRAEAAEILGLSCTVVSELAAAGDLDRRNGRITRASLYRYCGWPVVPAAVGPPL
jgi:phage baseplate assembly protein W